MTNKQNKALHERINQLEAIILNEIQHLHNLRLSAREQNRHKDDNLLGGIIRRLSAWAKDECLIADPVAEVNDHDVDLTKVQVVSKPNDKGRYDLTLVNGVAIPVTDDKYPHTRIRKQWQMVKRFSLWR